MDTTWALLGYPESFITNDFLFSLDACLKDFQFGLFTKNK